MTDRKELSIQDLRNRCLPPMTIAEEENLFTLYAKARKTINFLSRRRKPTRQEKRALRTARVAMRRINEELVLRNVALIVSVAKRFLLPSIELDDMIQDGVAKLMICADKFDLTKGYRFGTYLYRSLVFMFLQQRSLENRTWRRRIVSEDEDGEQVDYVVEPEAPDTSEAVDMLTDLRDALKENTANLTAIEMKVIKAMLDRKTTAEIALAVGLTSGRVKQIRTEAINKLKEVLS